ncbi:ABC transporter permease [Xanthomonas fragariae]|uniref:ABC transporter permease n=1 Tax=Xanthomonas fragariae TaxID=48664 RepID=A0A1Y6H6C4_9XANT|nr:ABC transporter permease [Xanthomonas fragariae]AOD15850.1 ABC transporter permease [Xanthomonas fragariae]AOD19271.1 ABC transporter permease [Xanthomonas fragariae]ENZ93713.1 ABC transporter permease [Xanthomonas fragariae LMG 25863]MBL9198208.1 MlaE family lipid ABC transporter permease subunit [Xanthomonas fragariae]MBL9221146.1 MlaE family lipid ABC transporter permease subunit [Xanthomonas fragariae]
MIKPQPPRIEQDSQDHAQVRLAGSWVLATALPQAELLQAVPDGVRRIDARGIRQLDSAGVLQLLRFASRMGLKEDAIDFRDEHQALVCTIEELNDERPKPKRDYGFVAALDRLGRATHGVGKDILELNSFLGENLVKIMRLIHEPRRFRLTSTVHHMEQVGLDAVPLVVLLSYLVGAVIAFLGSTILRDFGAEIYVVELVSIAFLREFAVLLTAIVLAGRTASAFTAQIGAMKSREEVDAIRTLGLDPIDLLVIPRLLALILTLPLLTFIAMIAGLAGGVTVGAFDLDIPPQMYLARMNDTIQLRHFLVGLSKAPLFAVVIGLIGCLEGLKVSGTAQSVGERTTSAVVQTISLVIILDAIAALWFMKMGW